MATKQGTGCRKREAVGGKKAAGAMRSDVKPVRVARTVEDLGLARRWVKCLTGENLQTVKELTRKKANELLVIHGFGWKALKEVRNALAVYGLTLRDEEGSTIKLSLKEDEGSAIRRPARGRSRRAVKR